MEGVTLRDYQYDALEKMRNGCILNGGVGSGKSRTALSYYYVMNGGEVNATKYIKMKARPLNLYIITTAMKRDGSEWELELSNFLMTTDRTASRYKHDIVIDSWNNIKKYVDVKDSFFIFDEQRVIGYGTWTKSFLKITKNNKWILLSATPGDTWSDYMPVFIANGWYKNKTDFEKQHVIWSRFTKFPMISGWVNEGRLIKMRNHILVDMKLVRTTTQNHDYVTVEYDRLLYSETVKKRWNPYTNMPIENASEFCYVLRKIVNSNISRLIETARIVKEKHKVIIFYNFDYELQLLRFIFGDNTSVNKKNDSEKPNKELASITRAITKGEWNGHKHDILPTGKEWVYLVQYTAGSEGWNCITTDTIIFYSQNYSYRVLTQASGRIDRMNTKYTNLYYYHLRSNSKIDVAIRNSQKTKKKFNERGFSPVFEKKEKHYE